MDELTRAQRRVLEFVREHGRLHGEGPTLARIAAGLGLSGRATVHKHVKNLVTKGRLRKNARGEIEAPGRVVPLAGSVRAGSPSESCAAVEDVAVPAWMATGGRMFALRVRGLSMRDAGILEGDIVLIDASRPTRSGEIVAARLGAETTLKVYRETAAGVRLMAANPDFPSIAVRPGEDFEVQGVVVGLLRRY